MSQVCFLADRFILGLTVIPFENHVLDTSISETKFLTSGEIPGKCLSGLQKSPCLSFLYTGFHPLNSTHQERDSLLL